jgi:2-polyprenyl-3-methyl-5-hydroxy-6-metoxy-1,4-benzoquinol methylase
MSSPGWDQFWKDERRSFHEVMKIGTTYFGVQLEKHFQLSPKDRILDYGCGPGFLADHLAPKNIKITGLDINDSFIKESRENHPSLIFITITTDIDENRRILDAGLGNEKFNLITLLSIAQYFESIDVLERIIKLLLGYTAENGRIILADIIDEQTSPYRDAFALMIECIRRGKVMAFARFIYYLLSSNYAAVAKKTRLLSIPEEAIIAIAEKHLLGCEKVDGLTIHPTRTNYVLMKRSGGDELITRQKMNSISK